MFDDVFQIADQCTDQFRNGVRDPFGWSIVSDVLDPIRREIGLLRAFHEDFQRQSLNIEQILRETRSLRPD